MEPTPTPRDQQQTDGSAWDRTLDSHRARQSERIAVVAMGIISAKGIAALSMSSLAEAAGVSRQTLYKYFADIDAVLSNLALIGRAGIVELAEQTAAAARPADGIRIFVNAIIDAAAAGHPSPAALLAAVPPTARDDLLAHDHEAEELVVTLLRRGQKDGSFRADLDPVLDGRIVYRAVLATHDLAAESGADIKTLSERVATDMLRILRDPGANPRGR